MRWAVASAREAGRRPVLTVMLLPQGTGNDAFQRWLAYPEVMELAEFGPWQLPTLRATCWQGETRSHCPKACTGHRLVAIGNAAGRQRLLNQDLNSVEEWRTFPPRFPGPAWPWRRAGSTGLQYDQQACLDRAAAHAQQCRQAGHELEAQYKPPTKLITASTSTANLWGMPPGWALPPGAQQVLAELYGLRNYQLKYDWKRAYFTDGSVQETEGGAKLVGAAVWRATGGPGGGPVSWLIHPGGVGPTNTINRAEGAAVFTTLWMILEDEEPAVIFTDSQWVIHMLRRAIWEPHTLIGNLHYQLLIDTGRRIVQRAKEGIHTSILKVKAHSGITGNEEADQAAKAAAQADAEHDFEAPEHCPFGGHWGVVFAQPQRDEQPATPGNPMGSQDTYRMLPNCRKALTQQLHGCCKTGHSKHGVHATLTAQMYKGREGDRALREESNVHWRRCNSRVTRVALKHRLGVWWHRGKAHKWRVGYRKGEQPPTDGMCPLCKECPDSSTHALLECRCLKAMQIKRHDKTVRKVLKALQRGGRQGSTYTVQVIEEGYCAEYSWREKVADKLAQHEELMIALRAAGWQVDATPHIIVVGALGAVFLSGQQALVKLGLDTKQARALLADLSVLAVEAVYEMTLMRRRLEGGGSHRAGVG